MNTLDRINFALEKIAYARACEAEGTMFNPMEKQAKGGFFARLLNRLKGGSNEVQQVAKGTRGTKEIKVTTGKKKKYRRRPPQQPQQQQPKPQQQQPQQQQPKPKRQRPKSQQPPVLPPIPPAPPTAPPVLPPIPPALPPIPPALPPIPSALPSSGVASTAQKGLLSRIGRWTERMARKSDPVLTNAGRALGSGLSTLGRNSSYLAKGLSQGTGKFIGAAGRGLGETVSNVGRGLEAGLSAAGKGLGAGLGGAIKGTAAVTGGLGSLVGRGTAGTARGLASAFRRNPLTTTALLGGGGLYALGDHADGFDSAWDSERTYGDNLYNIGHNIATGGNKAIDTVDSWVSPYLN